MRLPPSVTSLLPSPRMRLKYTKVHMVLLGDLLDNAEGANVPMRARGPIGRGEHHESFGNSEVRVHAAATVESLKDSGFPLDSMEKGRPTATSLVAKTLSQCGYKVTA